MLYVTLIWTIVLDNVEILTLTARPGDGMKRVRACPLVALEFLGLLFFLISFFMSFIGLYGKETSNFLSGMQPAGGEPGLRYIMTQWFLVFTVMGLHVVMTFIACLDGWSYRRTEPRRPRRELQPSTSFDLLD